jgi:hypothetical protein
MAVRGVYTTESAKTTLPTPGPRAGGEGHEPVHDAHEHRIDTTVVAGDQPDHDPGERREEHRRDADQQRDLGPVQDEAVHIASELVRTEQVSGARRLQALGRIEAPGVVSRDDAGEQRRQHDDREDRRAQHDVAVARGAPPPGGATGRVSHSGSADR